MPHITRTVRPAAAGTVRTETGEILPIPAEWELLPPGDGPLTKMVKGKGPSWLVRVKKGRRFISQGIWSHKEYIAEAKREIEEKRSAPGYARKRLQQQQRKALQHEQYVSDFYHAVVAYLQFHPNHKMLAEKVARSVTALATPVGSGTVARTEQIPLPERASRAVIAWLRHNTTAYDHMTIARVKGMRRQVRRDLAAKSVALLQTYRSGEQPSPHCPLLRAVSALGE